jgi:hypothetical protein
MYVQFDLWVSPIIVEVGTSPLLNLLQLIIQVGAQQPAAALARFFEQKAGLNIVLAEKEDGCHGSSQIV